jgi:hypothetical protein
MSLLIYQEPPLAFIHIPKSGGSSMTMAIKDAARRNHWVEQAHTLHTHAGCSDLCQIVSEQWLATAQVATVLRNPWARMLSLYHFRLSRALARIASRANFQTVKSDPANDAAIVAEMQEQGFSRWLQGARLHEVLYGLPLTQKSQLSWCRDAQGVVRVNSFLKLEALDRAILAQLGIDQLPHLNKSRASDDYRSHYDAGARDFVARHFAEDIECGGYRF